MRGSSADASRMSGFALTLNALVAVIQGRQRGPQKNAVGSVRQHMIGRLTAPTTSSADDSCLHGENRRLGDEIGL
ncbi:hypothetical protein Aca07nite_45220 [Actinoplanes capillaceus]|uniref:Uncharacterized protein n=1 Tax=Actinoplanes campanulatus TaxID=113559 RepID=A0ABQ3WM03_9ACTN|nr:hypothetical protein Aca07nite_45220 [Actinoplanes capillaceus]